MTKSNLHIPNDKNNNLKLLEFDKVNLMRFVLCLRNVASYKNLT